MTDETRRDAARVAYIALQVTILTTVVGLAWSAGAQWQRVETLREQQAEFKQDQASNIAAHSQFVTRTEIASLQALPERVARIETLTEAIYRELQEQKRSRGQ